MITLAAVRPLLLVIDILFDQCHDKIKSYNDI